MNSLNSPALLGIPDTPSLRFRFGGYTQLLSHHALMNNVFYRYADILSGLLFVPG
jgi:hypothetical protein